MEIEEKENNDFADSLKRVGELGQSLGYMQAMSTVRHIIKSKIELVKIDLTIDKLSTNEYEKIMQILLDIQEESLNITSAKILSTN